jgi:hypothetical protein
MAVRDRYFNKLPASSVQFQAQVICILIVAAVIWAGIGVWRRSQAKGLILVLDVLFLGLLVFPLDYFRVDYGLFSFDAMGGITKHPLFLAAGAGCVLLVLMSHRAIARGVALLISITFPAALLFFGKMVLLALNVTQLPQCAHVPPAPAFSPVKENGPRVLWIIFDETDYRLAFEKRPAGVKLPEFDKLRKESFCADHAYPPGDSTIISMPALITGNRLSAVEHDDCDLALTMAKTGKTSDWSATPTIFSKARELGFNTGLVGWYHPYERILGANLNYCSWYPFPGFELGRASTLLGSIKAKFISLTGRVAGRRRFIETCQGSLSDAASIVGDPKYGLILLHLPPPHLPGVYLPDKNDYTVLGVSLPAGYFNNLELADHELGVLRREMEKDGQWDKTWVILSADHSWRISKQYDGVRDFRVPFLVKSPGQKDTITYSRQFNTVLTQEVILGILDGQVTSPAGVTSILNLGKPELPVARPGEGVE